MRRGPPQCTAGLQHEECSLWIVVGASLAARMNARVERLWKAQGTTGAMVAYMGAVPGRRHVRNARIVSDFAAPQQLEVSAKS